MTSWKSSITLRALSIGSERKSSEYTKPAAIAFYLVQAPTKCLLRQLKAAKVPSRPAQSEETNLTEMAQRLEAALRRPIKPVEPAPPPGLPKEPAPELKVVPADKRARPAPACTSIEEEMASLLGRSTGKS